MNERPPTETFLIHEKASYNKIRYQRYFEHKPGYFVPKVNIPTILEAKEKESVSFGNQLNW